MDFLEKQFLKRKVIYSEGGYVEIIDIKPQKIKNNVPIILSSGWAETPEFLKKTIFSLANTGRRIIAIDYAHLDEVSRSHKNLSSNAKIKAQAIIKIIKEEKLVKIDVIAHSEGAINAILAANIQPRHFKNIILVAPAGMIGKDTFPKLLNRFMKELLFNPIRDLDLSSLKQVLVIIKYISLNPVQSFKEAVGISKTRIDTIVKRLAKKGIIIHIFHGKDDIVFPVNRLKDVVKKNHLNVHVIDGGHNDFHTHTEDFLKKINRAIV